MSQVSSPFRSIWILGKTNWLFPKNLQSSFWLVPSNEKPEAKRGGGASGGASQSIRSTIFLKLLFASINLVEPLKVVEAISPIPIHEVSSSGISQNQQTSSEGLFGNQERGSFACPDGMRTVLTDKRVIDSF